MNTFGRNFRCTTFGESHGKAVGVVVDGCPPGISLTEADIQPYLDRRRPGKSPLESGRQEADRVEVLSGTFEGRTTGAPIALVVGNSDVRSEDYDALRDVFRPGHADYAYQAKYGLRDHRGGGRSSGRETLARVAAGAVAMRCLAPSGITIRGRIVEVHGATEPDAMEAEIRAARDAGDSVGGVVEVTAAGCPAGLGDPVFGKLDAAIAGAMMGIGAVKGVEIGEGFGAARLFGSEMNDPIGKTGFESNHAGGILGGISTGQEIVVRLAVKPTPSIRRVQRTVDVAGAEREISVGGRHDPCIVPRLVPVAECMMALVIIDAMLEQGKYRGVGR
ncbi:MULTISPECIES: chorismate synthase [unclassified Methanoculleus]|jgi:chorismate synthase|uniref:chorismate synthase n=1 Tax=unclassified Methanoculleus TaxID=2619537 RepID=UPI0025CD8D73|nr:chorismate synthase [Methanoculleus sp. UBA377]MDD2473970.1 chorismate synthase [Methanoculleus sp.]